MLSRGADPQVRTKNYDPYLDPGRKTPLEVCVDDEGIRSKLKELIEEHSGVEKRAVPHRDIGCWWTLYDYGLETVRSWPAAYRHPYPEVVARAREREERRARREARRAKLGLPPLAEEKKKEKVGEGAKKVISVSATATAAATSSSSSFSFPPPSSLTDRRR